MLPGGLVGDKVTNTRTTPLYRFRRNYRDGKLTIGDEMSDIIYPGHFMIVEARVGGWFFHGSEVFYNPMSVNAPLKPSDILNKFGLSKQKITIELFRTSGGRLGYYLANLRDKKYYYCGEREDSIKAKLLELGIGRPDPMDAN